MKNRTIIQKSIIEDMSEGVMAIRFDGRIELVNEAVLKILERDREDLEGHSFARCFFSGDNMRQEEGANDAFTECVLDVIYSKSRRQERYVPYDTGKTTKQLRIVSSYLREGEDAVGVILVISDITELTQMRDAVRAMETIRGLNEKLRLRNRVLQETFGRYLSDDIVREILDEPGGWRLGGQKRTLTILMSDLRGFTMLCERMEPQDLIAMLNHYFSEMYEEISRYRGTLIEFLGDGMFVIFGAPVRSETHAADGVAAAIAMQNRMGSVNAWNAQRGYEPLSMGIAVNTDEVILGNLGSERRTKYGAVGQAVNLAGRLQSYTTEGQVLISPSTRAAVRVPLKIGQTITVSPKGVRGKMDAFFVAGIGAPYDLSLEKTSGAAEEEARMTRLGRPLSVGFYLLDDKHVTSLRRQGRILALSAGGAELETGEELTLFQSVMLDAGEGIYALVVRQKGLRSTVRFTGKPAEFDTWIRRILDGQEPESSINSHLDQQS